MNVKLKLIFGSVALMAIISIILGFFYFYPYFKSRDTFLTIKSPKEVLIGVPFEAEINFKNESESTIKDVSLSVILPDEVFLVDEPEKRVVLKDFKNLKSGDEFSEKIKITILGEEGIIKQFEVKISYLPEALGPKAIFEKTKKFEVLVKQAAVKLDLSSPQKVLNNEEFEIKINYQNISENDFSNLSLELNYPKFFKIKSSEPLQINKNSFEIPILKKGTSEEIIIIGSAIAPEQSFFDISAELKTFIGGVKQTINKKSANINIAASPRAVSIKVNEQQNYIAGLNDTLKYSINYKNNSDIGLNDVVIKIRLKGEMFSFSGLETNGTFSSVDNIVTFDAANIPNLRLLSPGDSGNVSLQIKTKQSYPIKRISDKNFSLKAEAEISSPTVPYYVAADKTIGVTENKIKMAGLATIDSKILFNDPSSGIINKGQLPLKANTPTNFTAHWLIYNYSTDIKNIELISYLESGVSWTGIVKSNASTTPSYNERTREIKWLIDYIPATKGIIGKPIEAIFQIEAIPNINQINREMPLTKKIILKAIDEFTGSEIISSKEEINSRGVEDIISSDYGTVKP